jgi:hypothetical protein
MLYQAARSCGCHSVLRPRRDHDLQSYHQHGQLQSPSPFRRLGLPGAAATQTARRVRSFRSSMHCAQATVFLPVTAADGRPPPIVHSPAVVLPGREATWEPPCTGTYGTVPHSAVRAAVLQLFVQQSVTRLGSSAYAPVGFLPANRTPSKAGCPSEHMGPWKPLGRPGIDLHARPPHHGPYDTNASSLRRLIAARDRQILEEYAPDSARIRGGPLAPDRLCTVLRTQSHPISTHSLHSQPRDFRRVDSTFSSCFT